jgi:hypothetical protein
LRVRVRWTIEPLLGFRTDVDRMLARLHEGGRNVPLPHGRLWAFLSQPDWWHPNVQVLLDGDEMVFAQGIAPALLASHGGTIEGAIYGDTPLFQQIRLQPAPRINEKQLLVFGAPLPAEELFDQLNA